MSGKTIISGILLVLAILLAVIAVIEFFMLHFITASIIFIVVTILAKIPILDINQRKERERGKKKRSNKIQNYRKSLAEFESKKKYFNSAI